MTINIFDSEETQGVQLKVQASTPTNPIAGQQRIYVKSDGLYILNSAGIESGPFIVAPVAHENGGLEADVSDYDGLAIIESGVTSQLKYNRNANLPPTVTDDQNSGYSVASLWGDTTANKVYVCIDATAGAAVWIEITSIGGGGGAPADASYVTINAEAGLTNETTLANALTSPPAIGGTTPASGDFSAISSSAGISTLTGPNVFNEGGADVDFRVEGNADQSLIATDATFDSAGIGSAGGSSVKFAVSNESAYDRPVIIITQNNTATTEPVAVINRLFSTATDAALPVLKIIHRSSTTAAAGFGSKIDTFLSDDAGAIILAGSLKNTWNNPTTAAARSKTTLTVVDSGTEYDVISASAESASRECQVTGNLDVNGSGYLGSGSIDASAIFQVDSTTKGALLPRMTETQRDAIGSPATGLEIYNTTSNSKNVYNGSAWVSLGGGGGSLNHVSILYNNGSDYTTSSATFADVDAANVILTITTTGGDVLVSFSAADYNNSTGTNYDIYDVTNGARIASASARGLAVNGQSNATLSAFSATVTGYVTGLPAGTHSFKLQWRIRALGTSTLYCTTADSPIFGIALEV